MSFGPEALYEQMPRLADADHRFTSQPSDEYNCVAWVDLDLGQWWEPGGDPGSYWPPWAPHPRGDDDLHCYIAVFEHWGYVQCDGPELEDGYLKIAIYARDNEFHHVAKQLRNGDWSSKVGVSNDLSHSELEALYDSPWFAGATAVAFMKKTDDGRDMPLEEGRLLEP